LRLSQIGSGGAGAGQEARGKMLKSRTPEERDLRYQGAFGDKRAWSIVGRHYVLAVQKAAPP